MVVGALTFWLQLSPPSSEIHTSEEGFGLTNAEHAVTGAPQIVADHSSLHELYEDCGLLIPVKRTWVNTDTLTISGLVAPEDIAEKFELIYSNKELYKDLSERSIKKFTSAEFSWQVIADKWDKIFKNALNSKEVVDNTKEVVVDGS
jgi:glycosyltransferase involved in cell wall biosynthesis